MSEKRPLYPVGTLGVQVDPDPLAQPDGSWRRLVNGDFAGISGRTPMGRSEGAIRKRGGIAPLRTSPVGSGPILSIGSVPLSSPFGGVAPPPAPGGVFVVDTGTGDWWVSADLTTFTPVAALAGLDPTEAVGVDGYVWFVDATNGLRRWDGTTLSVVATPAVIFDGETIATTYTPIRYGSIIYVAGVDGSSTDFVFGWDTVAGTVTKYTVTGNNLFLPIGADAQGVYMGDDNFPASNIAYVRFAPAGGGALSVVYNFPATDPMSNGVSLVGYAAYGGEQWASVYDPTVAPKLIAGSGSGGWSVRDAGPVSGATYRDLCVASGFLFVRQTTPDQIRRTSGGFTTLDYDLAAAGLTATAIHAWGARVIAPVGQDRVLVRALDGTWGLSAAVAGSPTLSAVVVT